MQRDQATRTIQPGPVYTPQGIPQINPVGSIPNNMPTNWGAGTAQLVQAQQWDQLARTANTAFDLIATQAEKDAAEQARTDAAQMIKRDGQGVLVKPADFEPPGLQLGAYRSAYRQTAQALYTQAATEDFQSHAAVLATAFPTDAAAIQQGLATKRQAMLEGLDPKVAPLLLLRFNAIEGQMVSRANAGKVTENLQVAGRSADQAYATFIDNGSKIATLNDKMSIDDVLTNDKLLAAQWSTFEGLHRGAGRSDASLAEYKEKAVVQMRIAADARRFKDMSFDAAGGVGAEAPKVKSQLEGELRNEKVANAPMLASVLTGMLAGESRQFDPTTIHDGGTGLGIAGWRDPDGKNGRRADMIAYAKKIGADPLSRDFQISYLVKELKASPQWQAFTSAKTTEEAMDALMAFIRPGNFTPANPRAANGYAFRLQTANALEGGVPPGQMDAALLAQTNEAKNKLVEQYGPVYGPLARQAFDQAIGQAQQQSSLNVAAFNQQETNRVLKEQVRIQAELAASTDGGIAVRSALKTSAPRVFLDPTLSDAGKIKMAAMYQQMDGMAQQEATQFYGAQATSLVNTMRDVNQPLPKQRAALQQLQDVLADPVVARYMPLSVKNYIESNIREVHKGIAVADVGGFAMEARSGTLAPEILNDKIAHLIDTGRIGDGPSAVMSMAEARVLQAQGMKAYGDLQHTRNLAGLGMDRWARYGMAPTETEGAAIDQLYPLKLPGNAALDVSNPEHRQAVQDHFRLTGRLPAAAQEQLANTPIGANPDITRANHEMYVALRSVVRSRPDVSPLDVPARMAQLLKSDRAALYLADVGTRGLDVATQAASKLMDTNSTSRQSGDQPSKVQAGLEEQLDRIVNGIPGDAKANYGWFGVLNAPSGRTQEAKDAAAMLQAAGYGMSAWNVYGGGNDVRSLKMDPKLRNVVVGYAETLIQTNGLAYNRYEDGGKDYALRLAMQNHKDLIDIVPVKDKPGEFTMTLRKWDRQVGESLALPGGRADQLTSYGLLEGIVQTSPLAKGGRIDYEPGTLQADLHLTRDGEKFWAVTAMDRGSTIPKEIERINTNDPRINGLPAMVVEAASEHFRKSWVGTGPGPTQRELGWLAGTLAGRMADAMNSLMQNTIGAIGSVFETQIRNETKKNIVREWGSPKDLQDLMLQEGVTPPSGNTDWNATIEKMQSTMTPAQKLQYERLGAVLGVKK